MVTALGRHSPTWAHRASAAPAYCPCCVRCAALCSCRRRRTTVRHRPVFCARRRRSTPARRNGPWIASSTVRPQRDLYGAIVTHLMHSKITRVAKDDLVVVLPVTLATDVAACEVLEADRPLRDLGSVIDLSNSETARRCLRHRRSLMLRRFRTRSRPSAGGKHLSNFCINSEFVGRTRPRSFNIMN